MVFGQLSLFADNGIVQSEKEMVLNSIKADMDSGSFDDAQDDVVRVTYVNLSPDFNNGSSGEPDEGTTDPAVTTRTSMVRVGLFLGAGMLVAVLVGIGYSQRRKAGQDDAQTDGLGDATQVP